MSGQVAVIGAGPAGLAAAGALRDRGVHVTVLDAGLELARRRHDLADHLGTGVGGTGLFSDGKFSYFPSGTHLYRLQDQSRLAESYGWCRSRLETIGIPAEPFPRLDADPGDSRPVPDGVKGYPSHYATLAQRQRLVELMCVGLGDDLRTDAAVHGLTAGAHGYDVAYRTDHDGGEHVLEVDAVVLATGRLGALDLVERRLASTLPLQPERYDIGIRIEAPSDVGFLSRMRSPDVKRIWTSGRTQVRTFCTCRDGEVWSIPFWGLSAVSGRSDGPRTGYSNFGLLARFDGDRRSQGDAVFRGLRQRLRASHTAVVESLSAFLTGVPAALPDRAERPWHPASSFQPGSVREVLGDELADILAVAVRELVAWSPDLLGPRTVCIAPAIEGTGQYPRADGDLRVADEAIWCAGDVVGRFRGLVPALVSGHYAGVAAAEHVTRSRSLVLEDAR